MRLTLSLLLLLLTTTINAQTEWSRRPSGFRLDVFAGFPTDDRFDEINALYTTQAFRFPNTGFAIGGNIPVYKRYYINASLKTVFLSQGFRLDLDMAKFPELGSTYHVSDTELNFVAGFCPHIGIGKWLERNDKLYYAEIGMSVNFFFDGATGFGGSVALDSIPGTSSTTKSQRYIEGGFRTELVRDLYRTSIEASFGRVYYLRQWGAVQSGVLFNISQGTVARGTYTVLPNTAYERMGKISIGGSYIGIYASFIAHRNRKVKVGEVSEP